MGGVVSTNSLSVEVGNKINQIANAECVNSIVSAREIKSSIINSIIEGDVTIGNVSMINGSSCMLRSMLSNELINSIIGNQKAEATDDDQRNAFDRLADSARSLTPWGAGSQMMESLRTVRTDNKTAVKMINEITQQINSVCQNRITNIDAPISSSIVDSTIKGNLTISDKQEISQVSCIIENGISNYVKNDGQFDQDAVTARSKGGTMIMAIVAIVIVIGMIVLLTGLSKTMGGQNENE